MNLHDLADEHGAELSALAEKFDKYGTLIGWKCELQGLAIELVFEEGWVHVAQDFTTILGEGFLYTFDNTRRPSATPADKV